MQYIGEKPIERITLKTYYSKEERRSHLYEDAGDGYGHEQGDYYFAKFSTDGSIDNFVISCDEEGNFQPEFSIFDMEIIGIPFKVVNILVDGNTMKFEKALTALLKEANYAQNQATDWMKQAK